MAYDTRGSFGTRRSRLEARDRQHVANQRIRGLRGDNHPFRWCPDQEVSILVGPDYLCPACGKLTTTS